MVLSIQFNVLFCRLLANIDHRTMEGEGQKVVHYAAKYGSLNVLELLIERGANPDERDDQWRTPLFEAARHGTCY